MSTAAERLERGLADLARGFRDAEGLLYDELLDGVEDANVWRVASREARLASIRDTASDLRRYGTTGVGRVLGDAAESGDVAAYMALARGQVGPALLGARTRIAATDAVVDAYRDQVARAFEDVERFVVRHADDVFAEAARVATVQRFAGSAASRSTGRADLVARLRGIRTRDAVAGNPALATLSPSELLARLGPSDGTVSAFVDRAGRRWSLSAYADMVTRTTTRAAVVESSAQRMISHGVFTARVSRHANPCPTCAPHEGRVVALTDAEAERLGVPPLSSLPNGGPPFHPNCRHTISPFVQSVEDFLGADAADLRRRRAAAQDARRDAAIARVRRDRTTERRVDPRRPGPVAAAPPAKAPRKRRGPAAETAPPPPDPTPAGVATKPLRDAFGVDFTDPKRRAEVDAALDSIGSAHRVPEDAPTLPIVQGGRTRSRGGSYTYRPSTGEHVKITVNVPESQSSAVTRSSRVTVAHEVGHFLDHAVIPRFDGESRADAFRSRGALLIARTGRNRDGSVYDRAAVEPARAAMVDLMGAILETETYRATARVPGAYGRYLAEPEEAFARAYSQWVAVRSGDESMLATIADDQAKDRGDGRLGVGLYAWRGDEFAAVASAFDALFGVLGWL